MTMDKSLRVRRGMARSRNVLRRDERITKLQESDRWTGEGSPLGLPKVRVFKLADEEEEKEEGRGSAEGEAAAPAAGAKAAGGKAAGGKAAGGKTAGKGGK